MKIKEVSCEEYQNLFQSKIIFDSADFVELNKYKVEQVHYYVFFDKRRRFGLAVGEESGNFYIPFSAPFGIIEPIRKHWDIRMLEDSIRLFDEYIKEKNIKRIRFILPPSFYEKKVVAAMQNILFRCDYRLLWQDLSYAFNLGTITEGNYTVGLSQAARKNLRIAKESGLVIEKCETEKEKELSYNVIAINRKEKGYPLRMSWEQVSQTKKIISHDFFVVYKDKIAIASAIVFRVCNDVAQVIYWGNISKYNNYKSINYLAYELIKFYKKEGFDYLDIGPSSECGIPNYGLCDFKDSIGCELSVKYCFEKSFE